MARGIVFRPLIWCSLLALASSCASASTIVRWKDGDDRCSLEYTVTNKTAETSIRIRFRRQTLSGVWNSDHTDTFRDNNWAEIKLAVPIRVKGSRAPQILVKLYRSNWLDYQLYAVKNDGVESAFAFSCRNEDAIQWPAKGKALHGLIAYDRFEPAPEKLTRALPSGTRLQLRSQWAYDAGQENWRVVAKRWVRYRFGDGIGSPVVSTPAACPFRYQ